MGPYIGYKTVTWRLCDGHVIIQVTERSQEVIRGHGEVTERSHDGHITVTGYKLQVTGHRTVTAGYCSYSLFDFIIYYMVDYVINGSILHHNNRKNLLKNQDLIRLSTNFDLKKISLNFCLCKNLRAARYIIYLTGAWGV